MVLPVHAVAPAHLAFLCALMNSLRRGSNRFCRSSSCCISALQSFVGREPDRVVVLHLRCDALPARERFTRTPRRCAVRSEARHGGVLFRASSADSGSCPPACRGVDGVLSSSSSLSILARRFASFILSRARRTMARMNSAGSFSSFSSIARPPPGHTPSRSSRRSPWSLCVPVPYGPSQGRKSRALVPHPLGRLQLRTDGADTGGSRRTRAPRSTRPPRARGANGTCASSFFCPCHHS